MYSNLSIVYDKLMDVDYASYKNIIKNELKDKNNLFILDLGCGSGNLTSTLAEYGKIFAIDVSEDMLAIASSKCPEATYFCLDLLDLEILDMKFNFIISAFDVFNYLNDFDEFKKGLKCVYNSLEKDGTFIFDIHTPKKIKYMLENQPFAYEDDDISYLWFTFDTENDLEVESELTFFIKEKDDLYKKMYEYQKQRTYYVEDIIKVIKDLGFNIDSYFCDFDFNNQNYEESYRIIFKLSK